MNAHEDSDPTGRIHAQADTSLRRVHMPCFWINFELSITVDATFYGVTIGMDRTTQA